ncbi:MAG: tRNA glutamyl-Q(34) synthetase GluQRS [Verrucomicrobiota bacterium]
MRTSQTPYRGRLAPSPTGYLHLGHARTFWIAQERCREANGVLLLRNEDLDGPRCKKEFVEAMIEDLRWFGFAWQEGPDCGGPFAPYNQSERMSFYRDAFEKLRCLGLIYPCSCSRSDVLRAARAPHAEDVEPIYPGTCRPPNGPLDSNVEMSGSSRSGDSTRLWATQPNQPQLQTRYHWRFQVPDGERIAFIDGQFGAQEFVAGKDFGDFVVWRNDGVPAYQLAVVVDDAAMGITEVVRGADLLISTARQILLYRALGLRLPAFYHCPLMTDEQGVRLAKRHDSLSLRELRSKQFMPEPLRAQFRF